MVVFCWIGFWMLVLVLVGVQRQLQTMLLLTVYSARREQRRRVRCRFLADTNAMIYFATFFASVSICPPYQPNRFACSFCRCVRTCIRFHPNANYVVTGSMDKTVRVWDAQTGNCVRLLAGHSGNVTCVAVSPSGRQVCRRSKTRLDGYVEH